ITFWDVLFIFNNYIAKDNGWSYIEKVIQRFLANSRETINTINKNIVIRELNKYAPSTMNFESLISFFLRKSNDDSIDLSFIMNQLLILENSFKEYLDMITYDNLEYKSKAQLTYQKVTTKFDSASIISFNYTRPPLVGTFSQ